MKELSKQDKDAIRDALLEYCGNYPSQNRASESLNRITNLQSEVHQYQ